MKKYSPILQAYYLFIYKPPRLKNTSIQLFQYQRSKSINERLFQAA